MRKNTDRATGDSMKRTALREGAPGPRNAATKQERPLNTRVNAAGTKSTVGVVDDDEEDGEEYDEEDDEEEDEEVEDDGQRSEDGDEEDEAAQEVEGPGYAQFIDEDEDDEDSDEAESEPASETDDEVRCG